MVNPLKPLPSLPPVPPQPAPPRSPAADRLPSPLSTAGRRPAGAFPSPLEASFRFEKAARQVVVKLIRPETREVVRQIPPEKILRLITELKQAALRAFDRRA